ncbi:hypothetical protein BDZ91DRAFT_259311 [Kalaharituber pfeilii]|nr:hypothetical protein BDZ91DRAFT_259311 [Kalaharituber pfeilii]
MPRTSEKAQIEQAVTTAIETHAMSMLLDSEEDEHDYELLEDLLMLDFIVSNHRYLYSRKYGSAGSHNFDVLDTVIEEYPESAFKSLFRMQRPSFKQLVESFQ